MATVAAAAAAARTTSTSSTPCTSECHTERLWRRTTSSACRRRWRRTRARSPTWCTAGSRRASCTPRRRPSARRRPRSTPRPSWPSTWLRSDPPSCRHRPPPPAVESEARPAQPSTSAAASPSLPRAPRRAWATTSPRSRTLARCPPPLLRPLHQAQRRVPSLPLPASQSPFERSNDHSRSHTIARHK